MTRPVALGLRDITLAAGAALALALSFALVLGGLAKPAGFRDRLDAVQAQTQLTLGLVRGARSGRTYDAGAMCKGDPADEAQKLRASISSLAMQSSVSLEALEVRPEDAAEGARLTPVRLRFAATGSYESVVGLLSALAPLRPELFVDTLDLSSKAANVGVKFSGRVLCAA